MIHIILSALEVIGSHDEALYKSTFTFTFTYLQYTHVQGFSLRFWEFFRVHLHSDVERWVEADSQQVVYLVVLLVQSRDRLDDRHLTVSQRKQFLVKRLLATKHLSTDQTQRCKIPEAVTR